MGKQAGVLKYTGKVGGMVGYYHKGKLCVRSLPEKVNRSEATRLSATDFGTASKAGKLVRYALKQELSIRHDSELTNRLNTSLLEVLYAGGQQPGTRSIQRKPLAMLAGFKLNNTTELGKLISFTPKVVQDGNNLRIAIPALTADDILHTRNTTHIEIKAIAAGINFNEGSYQNAVSDKVLIDLRKSAVPMELVLPFKAGEAETVVVLQVKAFHEEKGKLIPLGNRKYFAADIIDIIPSFQATPLLEEVEHNSEREQKLTPLLKMYSMHTVTQVE